MGKTKIRPGMAPNYVGKETIIWTKYNSDISVLGPRMRGGAGVRGGGVWIGLELVAASGKNLLSAHNFLLYVKLDEQHSL